MQDVLDKVVEAIRQHGFTTNEAMLVLRMTVGRQMVALLKSGAYKTVQGAGGACGAYVEKVLHRTYGQLWWRTCYLYASKLTEARYQEAIRRNLPYGLVDRAVRADKGSLDELLDEALCDRKLRRAKMARAARTGTVTANIEVENDLRCLDLVVSRPFDEDKVLNILSSILGDIKTGRAPITVIQFDRIVMEAKRSAGVGR